MDLIANAHDTAIADTDPLTDPTITLTATPAHEYLRHRRAIKDNPIPEALLAVPIASGLAVLLVAGLLWVRTDIFGADNVLPPQGIPTFLSLGALLLALGCICTVIFFERKIHRTHALEALDEDHEVVRITPPTTHLFISKAELSIALGNITPSVRDRLLKLAADGHTGTVEKAMTILLEEARQEWRAKQKEAKAALEATARQALNAA